MLCPRIYCDHCGRQIENASNAMAKWDDGESCGAKDIIVCHKGACDRATMDCLFWHELDVFLVYLFHNAGGDWNAAQERAQLLARIG